MVKHGLSAKVIAVNRVHSVANDLYPKLVEVFKPYVGEKILKHDGSFLKKIEGIASFVDMRDMHNMHNFRINSDYNLAWTIKTSEKDSATTCLYYSVGLYIANISNGVLTDIMNADQRRTDFTVEEVEEKQRLLKEAYKAYDKAKSALFPFEELDRNY